MRYRVKKDLVLDGTLLAWGDSLYLQQTQDKSPWWEVYSLFTRKLVGIVSKETVEEHLNEDESSPKEKFMKQGNKSIRDIALTLLVFLLPLWGICQQGKDPIEWYSKIVQTGDDIFELHISAIIDTNNFLYALNERAKCEICPVLKLEPSPYWVLLDGPALYYAHKRLPPLSGGSIPSPYCPVERFTGTVTYIQAIRKLPNRTNSVVKGYIEYYPTYKDSTGQLKSLMFSRALYSTSEQSITRPSGYINSNICIRTSSYYKHVTKKKITIRRRY
jgi:hypothetical protein